MSCGSWHSGQILAWCKLNNQSPSLGKPFSLCGQRLEGLGYTSGHVPYDEGKPIWERQGYTEKREAWEKQSRWHLVPWSSSPWRPFLASLWVGTTHFCPFQACPCSNVTISELSGSPWPNTAVALGSPLSESCLLQLHILKSSGLGMERLGFYFRFCQQKLCKLE